MSLRTDHPLLQKLIDRLSGSRDLMVSLLIHLIVVAAIAGLVAFPVIKEISEDRESGDVRVDSLPERPPETKQEIPGVEDIAVLPAAAPVLGDNTITTKGPSPFEIAVNIPAPVVRSPEALSPTNRGGPEETNSPKVGEAEGIPNSSRGPVKPVEFVAYLGQYGGNWNSTVRIVDGRVESGSLPNLLAMISSWSKNKIKPSKDVRVIKLDSDELLTAKPPFIFLSGSKDFHLTGKEIENLRNYLSLGGAVWGDGSVPGKNSAFDLAFRREMQAVVGKEASFAPLPSNHALYTQGYFRDIKEPPDGLNYYRQPVEVLRIRGEIAVIYTSNDYGDMWQVGLDKQGKIDLQRDKYGNYLTVNPAIYSYSETYLRNLTPEALAESYRFGMNVVVHLLNLSEKRSRTQQPL